MTACFSSTGQAPGVGVYSRTSGPVHSTQYWLRSFARPGPGRSRLPVPVLHVLGPSDPFSPPHFAGSGGGSLNP